MWAALPEGSDQKFDDAATPIQSQVSEGYQVFVVLPYTGAAKNAEAAAKARAQAVFSAAFEGNKLGVKFHPDRVERWFMRTVPGHGHYIGAQPWETHPQYSGPEDRRVFVYVPKLVEERMIDEAQKAVAEAAKARIQAKADAEKKAVDKTENAPKPKAPAKKKEKAT